MIDLDEAGIIRPRVDVTFEICRAINRAHPPDIHRILVACPNEYPQPPLENRAFLAENKATCKENPETGQNAPSLSVVTDRVAQYGLTENGQRARATV